MVMTQKEMMETMRNHLMQVFGGRLGHLGYMLMTVSATQQPVDVCFYPQIKRKPAMNVFVSREISMVALTNSAKAIADKLNTDIKLSNGIVTNVGEIWNVMPVPMKGITKEEMDAADLSKGEQVAGPNGETVKQMLTELYQCSTPEEIDYVLRRWICS